MLHLPLLRRHHARDTVALRASAARIKYEAFAVWGKVDAAVPDYLGSAPHLHCNESYIQAKASASVPVEVALHCRCSRALGVRMEFTHPGPRTRSTDCTGHAVHTDELARGEASRPSEQSQKVIARRIDRVGSTGPGRNDGRPLLL